MRKGQGGELSDHTGCRLAVERESLSLLQSGCHTPCLLDGGTFITAEECACLLPGLNLLAQNIIVVDFALQELTCHRACSCVISWVLLLPLCQCQPLICRPPLS